METDNRIKTKAKQKQKIFRVSESEESRMEARADEWAQLTGYRFSAGPFSGFARYMLLHAPIPAEPANDEAKNEMALAA